MLPVAGLQKMGYISQSTEVCPLKKIILKNYVNPQISLTIGFPAYSLYEKQERK